MPTKKRGINPRILYLVNHKFLRFPELMFRAVNLSLTESFKSLSVCILAHLGII